MHNTSLLLVEDNILDARLITSRLQKIGCHTLTHVGSLQQAVDWLNTARHVDVIVLDLTLPDSLGLHTFQYLHQRFAHIPIVILSGRNDQDLAVKAVSLGAQDYVFKSEASSCVLLRSIRYAIERMRLLKIETDMIKMDRDLEFAREIQRHLLPQTLPEIAGVDMASTYIPANWTGGDFFDVIPISRQAKCNHDLWQPAQQMCEEDKNNSIWGLTIADVSSHGFAPSLIMVDTRRVLRTCSHILQDPGEILTFANRAVNEVTLEGQFVTLCYGRYDPLDRTLEYCSAGHPFWVIDAEGTVSMPEYAGTALGLLPDFQYATDGKLQLNVGDFLVVVTDGLYECRSDAGEFFGIDRVCEIIKQHREKPSKEIVKQILKAIYRFSGSLRSEDDITILLIKMVE
ncbi:SpoIIE family protein phosphatase [Gimesia panareensis]|uniref:Phosphoserine phosphatase RsbU n=1 Tax=Gimesia panareensis TaxID=2527978 RepID=A0A517Q1L9_9PLAN|nr:SpoIIE family protein phosphatase [Gimesia panareensis]QDT25534.1 Phosphoserine phosphatase RsbU [Gimesia panareensis]QDU48483.1 Phosphoserine phosphatase RsbU [Gimesia panareensis]